VIRTPPFRKASSRSRCASVSKLKTVDSKTWVSGLKVTDFERGYRRPALVALLINLAIPPDFKLQRLRQRVDHRDADAMKPAGDLVAVVVELAAGVKDGQHDLRRRLAARVTIDGNAAPVVDDRHRAVDVNRDVDLIAEAGERLVNRVVDYLVDQVMQSSGTG